MGRKGCVRGAGADRGAEWGPSFGLSRGTRRSPWSFGGVAAATVAAAEAAEAAEAATVAGAKARGSNDMTELGLRRESSVRPGLSSSRSMMRVAARSVKPSSGLVCTKWPASVRVATSACGARVPMGRVCQCMQSERRMCISWGGVSAPRRTAPPFSWSSGRSSTATKLVTRCRP
eukprot:scaffold27854_cov60-Phaeocystis_antarctica.AAC.1